MLSTSNTQLGKHCQRASSKAHFSLPYGMKPYTKVLQMAFKCRTGHRLGNAVHKAQYYGHKRIKSERHEILHQVSKKGLKSASVYEGQILWKESQEGSRMNWDRRSIDCNGYRSIRETRVWDVYQGKLISSDWS